MTPPARTSVDPALHPASAHPLAAHLAAHIHAAGGWVGFDDFMAQALYTPCMGYYTGGATVFGMLPGAPSATGQSGSDFVTAPAMPPLFGRALARQSAQAIPAPGTEEVAASDLSRLSHLGSPVCRG